MHRSRRSNRRSLLPGLKFPGFEPAVELGTDFGQEHSSDPRNRTAQHLPAARSSSALQRHAVRRITELPICSKIGTSLLPDASRVLFGYPA